MKKIKKVEWMFIDKDINDLNKIQKKKNKKY